MIEPWELLLHHSYAGSPGVIFDRSPGRTGHGTAVHLSDSDFLPDGAATGSGAIALHPGSAVDVRPTSPWSSLDAIRCEFVCSCDSTGGGGTLIDAGSFKFGVTQGTPSLDYGLASGGSGTRFGPVSSEGTPAIPFNQWVTVGFVYDGVIGASGFILNGTEITRWEDIWQTRLLRTSHAVIGNARAGGQAWTGRIDDVKVWRRNPHYIDNTFINRPADPATRDCWKRWSDALGVAIKEDPECARHVRDLIKAAVAAITRRALQGSPATAATWQAAIAEYQRLWPTGDFNGIARILSDLVSGIGGDLQLNDPALTALATDPCVQRIFKRLPSLDCDPGFTGIFKQTASLLEVQP
ncbi:MAG: LamG-like jellyroll fold domain-containing protein [Devosia sp.]